MSATNLARIGDAITGVMVGWLLARGGVTVASCVAVSLSLVALAVVRAYERDEATQ